MCLLTLTKIDQMIPTYHFICMNDDKKCEKTNINALVKMVNAK